MTRRLAARVLPAIVTLVAVGAAVGLLFGFDGLPFAVAEIAAIAGLFALDRLALPIVDRWDRGADGEEHVGAVLDDLRSAGWLAIHDADLGRGNVDHIVIGPGGILTVETKSHAGRVSVARIDQRWLKQAYAEAKVVERLADHEVTPLLVFSRAYLDRPVSRHRGVTVLPARMLAGHLVRRPILLTAPEIANIHTRISAALP
jgi:hypothetical protein